MSEKQLAPALKTWLHVTDRPPADSHRSASQIMARLPEREKRHRGWPFRRRTASIASTSTTTPQATPTTATNWHSPVLARRSSTMSSATLSVIAGVGVALFGGFLLISQPFEQQAEGVPGAATGSPATSSPAATLPEPRYGYTATRLTDGRVLIVGGGTPEGRLASAGIWDPVTGAIEPTGSLANARGAHTATLLPDGRVLVIGGSGNDGSGNGIKSAEVWDPVTGTFEPTGKLKKGRRDHTATLLTDGRVLVISDGNQSRPDDSAEVWDPVTAAFGPAGSLAEGRYGPTATLLTDGRVLVVGGFSGAPGINRNLTSAEVWDPATGSFGPTGPLAEARHGHTATLLPDGRVLVVGGVYDEALASAEVWDPATGTFGPAGSVANARLDHTATLLPDGRVLVAGGGYGGDDLATTEVWDPATESFGPAVSLAQAHAGHTATLLPGGRVLIVGGLLSDRQPLSTEVWEAADE